jgi:hypothetical protein
MKDIFFFFIIFIIFNYTWRYRKNNPRLDGLKWPNYVDFSITAMDYTKRFFFMIGFTFELESWRSNFYGCDDKWHFFLVEWEFPLFVFIFYLFWFFGQFYVFWCLCEVLYRFDRLYDGVILYRQLTWKSVSLYICDGIISGLCFSLLLKISINVFFFLPLIIILLGLILIWVWHFIMDKFVFNPDDIYDFDIEVEPGYFRSY